MINCIPEYDSWWKKIYAEPGSMFLKNAIFSKNDTNYLDNAYKQKFKVFWRKLQISVKRTGLSWINLMNFSKTIENANQLMHSLTMWCSLWLTITVLPNQIANIKVLIFLSSNYWGQQLFDKMLFVKQRVKAKQIEFHDDLSIIFQVLNKLWVLLHDIVIVAGCPIMTPNPLYLLLFPKLCQT